MDNFLIGFAAVGITITAYLCARWLYHRYPSPLLLPVFIGTIFIISILFIFNINYGTYMKGAKWIDAFLGPAVVALAYPLYQNRGMFIRLLLPIGCGTLVGSLLGISTGVFFAKIIGYDDVILYSLAPKSVTTPVAMDISQTLSGISSLAVVFVMIAGISGAICSTVIFSWLQLDHFVGRGVALGSASHAIGIARSLENGLEEGSVSTVAMILCAIIVSIITPFVVGILI